MKFPLFFCLVPFPTICSQTTIIINLMCRLPSWYFNICIRHTNIYKHYILLISEALNVCINAITMYIFCNCLHSTSFLRSIHIDTSVKFIHFNCRKVFHWINISNLFIHSSIQSQIHTFQFFYKWCVNTCLLVHIWKISQL